MKKQINLYQPSCHPKSLKANFAQFLTLLFASISLILASYFFVNQQTETSHQALAMHKAKVANQQQIFTELGAELQKKRAPDEKLRLHDALQQEVVAKQRLLASIAGIDVQELVSFSALMRGLSYANMADLSIQHFSMVEGILNINGVAKHSDSVPQWLANMQVTKELSGVSFKSLAIEKEEQVFTFQLTNSNLKGKANE